MIRKHNRGKRGTREIGWKVSPYKVQEGGCTSKRNPGWEVYKLGQTHSVSQDLCCNAVAGCCRVNSQSAVMVTVEIAVDEIQRVRMGDYECIYVRGNRGI